MAVHKTVKEPTSEAAISYIEPRGHEAQEQHLLRLLAAQTLPQTLCFHGPKGIGKASFAQQFCCYLLSGGDGQGGLFGAPSMHMDAESPTVSRVLARSHSDLLWITPSVSGQNQTPIIKVEDARTVGEFFSKTAGESTRRIVVIDGADALNANAANALLKVVEEPPINALMILILHQTGKMLPTLWSRCQKIAFKAPDEALFFDIFKSITDVSSREESMALYALAMGSVGGAVQQHRFDMVTAYHHAIELFSDYPRKLPENVAAIAAHLEAHIKQGAWQPWCDMWLFLIERLALNSVGAPIAWVSAHEKTVFERIQPMQSGAFWLELHQRSRQLIGQAIGLHLDSKHVIQSLSSMAFHEWELAA